MEKSCRRGKGRILTKSQGMLLRPVRTLMSNLFCQLFLDSGGRAEEAPSRLLEAEAFHVVSLQPAEHRVQLPQLPPHPFLSSPGTHTAGTPSLLPQPEHQPRQRAESDLRSSFRTQQPQIGSGSPQGAPAQTAGRPQVNHRVALGGIL